MGAFGTGIAAALWSVSPSLVELHLPQGVAYRDLSVPLVEWRRLQVVAYRDLSVPLVE
ncbi:hypothetical protein GCM10027568_23030 [Humibacter soli]